MLTHIIIIINIIISGFTEHISDVLEDFLRAAIIIIILLHTVAMVHAVDLILWTWNIMSHDPLQTCCLLKCQRVNMHHLTFPPGSSIVREEREEATVVSPFTWSGFGDTRRKDWGFTVLVVRELILHLCPGVTLQNVNRYMFMLELNFHPLIKQFPHEHHSVSCSISLSRYTFCTFNPIDSNP